MATPNLFITGATGYIGGDALYCLMTAHPDWNYTLLVRDSKKGAQVAAAHPTVRLVYGDLAALDLIRNEAAKADVVLNFASSDDQPSAQAIVEGLVTHSKPAFWMHISGGGMLTYHDTDIKQFGYAASKVWDDIDDIVALTTTTERQTKNKATVPQHASHRVVEEFVLNAAADHPEIVRLALVSPPLIYGTGRGPVNKRSMQVPDLAKYFIEHGQGVVIEEGENKWSNVHIHDLGDFFLRLTEDAVSGGSKGSWSAEDGYYFVEGGESSFNELNQTLAEKALAKKFLKNKELARITVQDAEQIMPHAGVLLGANSRSRASRARKVFGWNPTAPSLNDTLDEALVIEAKALDVAKGHADVAAGN